MTITSTITNTITSISIMFIPSPVASKRRAPLVQMGQSHVTETCNPYVTKQHGKQMLRCDGMSPAALDGAVQMGR